MTKTVSLKEYMEIKRQRVEETFSLDPKVRVRLSDKKEYILEFDNAAMKGIYLDTQVNVMTDGLTSEQLGNPLILESVVYHGLLRNQPDMTVDSVNRMISFRHMLILTQAIFQALTLFMPDMSDYAIHNENEASLGEDVPVDPILQ